MKQAVPSPPLPLGNMRDAKDAAGAQLLRKAECYTPESTGCPVLQVLWLGSAVSCLRHIISYVFFFFYWSLKNILKLP